MYNQLNEDVEDLENWRKSGINMYYDSNGQLCLDRNLNRNSCDLGNLGSREKREILLNPNTTEIDDLGNLNSDLKFVIIGLLILILIK